MRVCLARLDMVHVQPYALPGAAPTDHARLVAVFEQDLIANPGPLIRIQKLLAPRMREMLGVAPPETDALDEMEELFPRRSLGGLILGGFRKFHPARRVEPGLYERRRPRPWFSSTLDRRHHYLFVASSDFCNAPQAPWPADHSP